MGLKQLLVATLVGAAASCGPTAVTTAPVRDTVMLIYYARAGRIVVPAEYDGGVMLCVQDAMNLGQMACIRLIDLRRELLRLQNASVEPVVPLHPVPADRHGGSVGRP